MFNSINLPDIKKYFSSNSYEKGLEIYNNNGIIQIEDIEDRNILFAKIQESSGLIYSVRIYYDLKEGKINETICSCASKNWCMHAVATLLYYKKKIKEKNNSQEEFNLIKPVSNIKEIEYKINETNNLCNFLDFFKFYKKEEKKEEFYPVFCLYFDNFDLKWILLPGKYSISKKGKPTKIRHYSEEDSIIPFSDEKIQKLFNNLVKYKSSPFYRIENIIDEILSLSIPVFFFNSLISDGPINFKPIEEIQLDFKVKKVNLDKGIFHFDRVIFLKIGEVERINISSLSQNKFIFKKDIFLFVREDKNSVIYLKEENNKDMFLFLKKIIEWHDFSIKDINKIREILNERKWENKIKLDFNQDSIVIVEGLSPTPVLDFQDIKSDDLDNFEERDSFTIFFRYMDREIAMDAKELYINSKLLRKVDLRLYKRNFELELYYKELLLNMLKPILGKLEYNIFENSFSYPIKISFQDFLKEYGEKLITQGFEIRYNGEMAGYVRGKFVIFLSSEIDWLEGKLKYQEDDTIYDIFWDVSDLVDGKVLAKNKVIYLNSESLELLKKLCNQGMENNGNIRISYFDFSLINELYYLIEQKEMEIVDKARKIVKSLEDFSSIENVILPKSFKGTLRDYQQVGVNWLNFLFNYNLNGCLADDMGLGKTIQTIALLSVLFDKKEIEFVLIVAPVSTLINWQMEFNRFAPDLKVLVHKGADRNREKNAFKEYQIIITSYHTLRNDIAIFKDMRFDYLILDESQNIKNHVSLLFKTVKIINSAHRLALSGTPIENHTMELWSLMNFLNPGLLGSARDFKNRYALPIEQANSVEKATRLAKMVLPFILRRTKKEVLKDLPEKEEIVYYCEMGEEQRKVYEGILVYYRNRVIRNISRNGIERSMFCILEALLRLRQVCLFASLFDKEYSDVPSCKFEAFCEVVEDILKEKHKILIFSQFVEVLKIIEDFVKKNGWQYCYIDGSTTKREKEISKFQTNDDFRLFLLSLKAGGFGINLTKADYVILFDPWWNPAVESQAIDRTHRIGQTNKVIAYKFIVKDTVEEKILLLQEKKKNLFKDLIAEDSSFLKNLSKEDIIELFS